MSTLLTTFQSRSTLEELQKTKNATYYDMSAEVGSTFLDIGSGFGKPVFHSAIQTGCESFGIEIVPVRVSFCEDQKYNFIEHYQKKRQQKSSSVKPVKVSKQSEK
jgi:cyclopropane fatty-acyl-phospholipid synthase-like methyltransferase